jgi:sugar lactone lactonase YvrE
MRYQIISKSQAVLGEGISIKPDKSLISWVDITGNKVHWKSLKTESEGCITDLEFPSCTFSDENFGVYISHSGGIDWVDGNFRNRINRTNWFPNDCGIRCNDGKMDAAGNIWISTMSISHLENEGSIWFWDRKSTPKLILDSLTIPNSIAIDNLRNRVYFADSREGSIYYGEISTKGNSITGIHEFYSSSQGVPDGSTLDAEGNLWNTRWDGSAILKIRPSGVIDLELPTPFERPTSCVLGENSNEMYVTSAYKEGDSLGGYTIRLNY